jgi:hypothetical protein
MISKQQPGSPGIFGSVWRLQTLGPVRERRRMKRRIRVAWSQRSSSGRSQQEHQKLNKTTGPRGVLSRAG